MPVIRVRSGEKTKEIVFTPGLSLREILETSATPIRTGCNGNGACGLCRVRIIAGRVHDPSQQELLVLGDARQGEEDRLACYVRPEDDLGIEIIRPAPDPAWKTLRGSGSAHDTGNDAGAYGVAVDLGTTQISISLLNLDTGRRIAGRLGTNPQAVFGADVMTRLVAAVGSAETANRLSNLVVSAIGEGLAEIAGEDGLELARVTRLMLVGNTAMLALLSGKNYQLLVRPETWMEALDCVPDRTEPLTRAWGIRSAAIRILPPLAGFVGSDLLAGVLATRMTGQEAPALLIDFGTNSEIALWDGRNLSVTSAAGGPAFEGSGMRRGLPAESGAICRVGFLNGVAACTTIAGTPARGICSTGLVDLIAHLTGAGILSEKGRFSSAHIRGFILSEGDPPLVLNGKDVDLFQRAKAAVGAGVQALIERAGIGIEELAHCYVCGTFGHNLDIVNARAIGLLPMIPEDRIELSGNTALAGCEQALLDGAAEGRLEAIRRSAVIVNLAGLPDFDDLFLENLYLRPMGGA